MQYSAGFTKEKWSEREMAIVIKLMEKGLTKQEILNEVIENNLFQLRSALSINNRFGMVYRRSMLLDGFLRQEFLLANDFNRKALTLYSFLKAYRIPKEFYYEVILQKYNDNDHLFMSDFHYFFEKKAIENEKVSKWRPETVKRLINSLSLFFRESDMIERVEKKQFKIKPIYISQQIKEYTEDKVPLLYSFTVLEKVNE